MCLSGFVLLQFVFMGVFGIMIHRLCVSCVFSGCTVTHALSRTHYFLNRTSTNTQRGHKNAQLELVMLTTRLSDIKATLLSNMESGGQLEVLWIMCYVLIRVCSGSQKQKNATLTAFICLLWKHSVLKNTDFKNNSCT